MDQTPRIAILGGGNIGRAIAAGLLASGQFPSETITITRRHAQLLTDYQSDGFRTTTNNFQAVSDSTIIILAVQPQQFNDLMNEVVPAIQKDHVIISIVSGVSITQIGQRITLPIPIIRAMPNTAIAIRESMTCLAAADRKSPSLALARSIFDTVGATMVIDEELMGAATALCACGIAFFLRSIRAASQGGIEIGFHAEEAIIMAAQTAKGAAGLLLNSKSHPEDQIDKVTTPRGITITGLNEMEHKGFSSAMIKGITTSAEKAQKIYMNRED